MADDDPFAGTLVGGETAPVLAPGGAVPGAAAAPVIEGPDPFAGTLRPADYVAGPSAEQPLTWSRAGRLIETGAREALASQAGGQAMAGLGEAAPIDWGGTGAWIDPSAVGAATTKAASEKLTDWLGPETAPKSNLVEQGLAGLGAGAANLPYAMLTAGGGGVPAALRTAASTLFGGVGSGVGRELAAQAGGNPLVQELGATAGGLIGGVAPATAEGAVTGAIKAALPFSEAMRQRQAGRIVSPGGAPEGITDADVAGLSGGQGELGDIETRGLGQVNQVRADRNQAVSDLWQTADLKNQKVDLWPYVQSYVDFEDGLTAAKRDALPDKYQNIFNTLGEKYPDNQVPLQELQDLRSGILKQQRATRKSDPVLSGVLGELDGALFRGLPDSEFAVHPDMVAANPSNTQAWNDAIGATSQFHQDWGKASPIGRILGGANEDDMFSKMLKPGGNYRSRVDAFLDQTDPYEGRPVTVRDENGLPVKDASGNATTEPGSAQQAARDWFMNQFRPAADAGSGARFLANNNYLVNSRLFTDAQRTLLNGMARAGEAGATLSAHPIRGLSDVMGMPPWVPTAAGSAAAGAATLAGEHLLGFNPLETIGSLAAITGLGGGAALGGGAHAGGFVPNVIYGSPMREMGQLLSEAATNPAATRARALQAPGPGASPRARLAAVLAGTGYGTGANFRLIPPVP